MASFDPIKTPLLFPEHIDRDAFGNYISGLTDGEGSFILDIQHPKETTWSGGARFRILIREDDYEVISLIHAYWQCGQIYSKIQPEGSKKEWAPAITYNVGELSMLTKVVVPHFHKYPLYAKKKRDFEIWSKAVAMLYEIKQRPQQVRHVEGKIKGCEPKWTDSERTQYLALVNALRSGRQYSPQRTMF